MRKMLGSGRRPSEVIDHAITDAKLLKQRLRADCVITPEHMLTAIKIDHGVKQPGNTQPIGNRQAAKVAEGGEHLSQGARQRQCRTEYRCCGFQSIG